VDQKTRHSMRYLAMGFKVPIFDSPEAAVQALD
jgi:hypothetical protein